MADLVDKVNAELENISTVLTELNKIANKPAKSLVELAGVGTFLHNIYNGIENILKQILGAKGVSAPKMSESWHRDLLALSLENGIISKDTQKRLADYLAFRHFFSHSYSFLLDEVYLKPLVDNMPQVYVVFKKEIENWLSKARR